MKERILTKEEQILVLETQIKERAVIVYVLESAIADNEGDEHEWPESYKAALKDEITNHNTIIEEYKQLLKEITDKEWVSVHAEKPVIKKDWRHSPDVELKMPNGKELIGYYHIGGPDIPIGFRQILDGLVIDEIILPTHWRYIN